MRKIYLTLSIIVISLQACSVLPINEDHVTTSSYKIPEPAGPIRNENGVYGISPILLEKYIINPGIGWQDGPERYGIVGFPSTVAYSDRHLISWSTLNPQEGVYDWSNLDQQISQAADQGNQFSFRIYTMIGEGYGGHQVPLWVLDKGAVLLGNGEPDYSDCIYQDEWSRFIYEVTRRYDGNPDIAFIDISGYGNFNEWSWEDIQTEWDAEWETAYLLGEAAPGKFTTLDGQARRRLADMFIGGSFQGHKCRMGGERILNLDYSYAGFQESQLVMPFAGIVQSAQYVFSRRKDVGFRYDCLGYDGEAVYSRLDEILSELWKTAPVVFEMCKPEDVEIENARWLLERAHGSIVHNNNWQYDKFTLEDMMKYAGYRFFLKEMSFYLSERKLSLDMDWQNLGYSPNYSKMGQDFHLYAYLLNYDGQLVFEHRFNEDISAWKPLNTLPEGDGAYRIAQSIDIPEDLLSGRYLLALAITDHRTGQSVQLAMGGRDENGYYVITAVDVE